METFEFLQHFEAMPQWMRFGWLVGCIFLFWVLEGAYPYIKKHHNKKHHDIANFTLLAFTMAINVAFGFLAKSTFEWIKEAEVGLLYLLDLPAWGNLIVALLAMDLLAQYTIHILLHKVPFLFRFHTVHHNDTHYNASTGTRHHPGDFIARELFALLACIIIGAPVEYYFFYRFLTIPQTYWTHSNLKVPAWVDKTVGLIFITPNMHKFHHHDEVHWTDSNYGNVFSIWDRLFGTLVIDNTDKINYGLDIMHAYDDKESDVLFQLKIPFIKRLHK